MDPATIGLLISIAPTVLDILFGRGNVIKHESVPKRHVQRTILENPESNRRLRSENKMYGYGLEGYGYRYPPIEGYYEEPIVLGKVQKEGPRKELPIKRYLPKGDERWMAAYILNERAAKKNKWRDYATKALREASKQYLEDLKKR
jgi:hypothetical protein